ncbi:hypothetical protein [Pseudorhodobacter ferrugineus]|uniref:hypothetical protein n=1 Tax=Pseudorhodobacter ferrugineus TaxID=77008 RepID=UPI0012DCA982|nr:hypothetical protein [Pseudorhodobacter ferrugineus]
MTKVGRQDREPGTGVARPIAIEGGANREAVPQIVDQGSAGRRARTDAAVMQPLVQDRLHHGVAHPFAARID